ncbi:DUF6446 family protein [Roseicyclus sp. F158]|uniref:DUF6446 family protein n=1 Tax=Tropicimonas omnivorans TaxID=3075590 RepID=A0ABU3DFY3_9RHOB|nr:DUF6446 family protein [Roseicyclus sp. F158]MDT0682615.1 DUF6446 family protein [Roseicyclus sp. F158]
MNGKVLGMIIIAAAALVGAGVWWTAEYAYFEPVEDARIELTRVDGTVEPILAENVEAIDRETSPISYRACFETSQSDAMLTETYEIYAGAEPLNASRGFACFDADAIGEALEQETAIAYLGRRDIEYGIDRVVAITEDGRGYAWNQINECGAAAFDGQPLPPDCPPAPERN